MISLFSCPGHPLISALADGFTLVKYVYIIVIVIIFDLAVKFTAERPNLKAHVSHDIPLTEILFSAYCSRCSAFGVRHLAFGVLLFANYPCRS